MKTLVLLLSPQQILEQIVRTVGGCRHPAAFRRHRGSDRAAVRGPGSPEPRAVMAYAPDAEGAEAVMHQVRQAPFSFAQKYCRLVIEDLA